MSSSCFGFLFDRIRLLKNKLVVSCVSTCFTIMLDCFKMSRRFRFFMGLTADSQ